MSVRAAPHAGIGVSAKLLADLAGRGLSLLVFVAAARLVTQVEFGAYSFALAIGLIGAQLADGGFQFSVLRRLSDQGDPAGSWAALRGALRSRLLIGTAAVLAAGGLAALAGSDAPGALALATIAGAPIVAGQGELWLQVARAAGRLELEALVGVAARALLAAVGITALILGAGLAGLAAAHLVSAITLVALSRLAARRTRPAASREDSQSPAVRPLTAYLDALPLAVAGAASLLMFRVDSVLLQWLAGSVEVGRYAAAYRPFEVGLLPAVAVMAWGFPQLVRAATDARRWRTLMGRVSAALLAGGLLVAVAGWMLGPLVLELLFGSGFAISGDVLRLLVLALPAMYLNALLTQALIAKRRPWHVALAMGLALGINVVANLALIPRFGPLGAAGATVAAEACLLTAAATLLWRSGAGRSRPTA